MDYKSLTKEFIDYSTCIYLNKSEVDQGLKGETLVLYLLSKFSQKVLPSELSTQTRVSTARIAATLNSLEKKELIRREIDLTDRRKILIQITEKGKEKFEEEILLINQRMEERLRYLGEDDAKSFVRITGRLAQLSKEKAIRPE